MSTLVRRDIPLIITFATGTIALVNYFLDISILETLTSTMMNFGVIIIGFLYLVGSGNLIIYQVKEFQRRPSNDINKWLSAYALFVMAVFFITGLWYGEIYSWLIANVRGGAGIGISAITGCAIIIAAYRSFRARSIDSTMLLIAGVITMFGLAPIGGVIHPSLPGMQKWLLDILTRSANRGMTIGLGIGGIYTAIRTWLGLERRALGV